MYDAQRRSPGLSRSRGTAPDEAADQSD